MHRFKGELLLRQDDLNGAEAQSCFQRAIEIARDQSAKSWELRATMSLARLLRDTACRHEARAMLSEIYGWFTEGFDTADLKEAKALLDELSR
jgi:predicted ATPase